jgi:hypothetical protein
MLSALVSSPPLSGRRSCLADKAGTRAGCFAITTVFSHAQTVVICGSCASVLCQPTGGKARLTEGACSLCLYHPPSLIDVCRLLVPPEELSYSCLVLRSILHCPCLHPFDHEHMCFVSLLSKSRPAPTTGQDGREGPSFSIVRDYAILFPASTRMDTSFL